MIIALQTAAAASSLSAGCIPQTLPISDAFPLTPFAEDGSSNTLLPVLSTTLLHVKQTTLMPARWGKLAG